MTDLVLSTKWVNRIECSFADRPDSTNGDSVLPYCQQNGLAVQNVVSVIDPLQQIMTLKIGETTNYTAGSSIHINKFVDQQYGSTTQIVVSAPTSTNGPGVSAGLVATAAVDGRVRGYSRSGCSSPGTHRGLRPVSGE